MSNKLIFFFNFNKNDKLLLAVKIEKCIVPKIKFIVEWYACLCHKFYMTVKFVVNILNIAEEEAKFDK